MSRGMTTVLAALAAMAVHAGGARAQAMPQGGVPAGVVVQGGTVSRVSSAPPLGFGYTGQPAFGEDGRPRFADFPVVTRVQPDSPPARAGIAVGDAIVAVNGHDGREPGLFRQRAAGTRYVVKVRRGTEEKEITFVMAAPPAAPAHR